MKPITTLLLGIVIAASAAVAVGAETATLPATRASATRSATLAATRPSASDYEILQRKSIFAKDRSARRLRGSYGSSTGPVVPREVPAPVFIGVVHEDTGPVAFLEEPDTGRLLQIHVGEPLPRDAGIVQAITLDYIEFAAGSDQKTHRIAVGQNVLGITPEPRPVAVATTTTAPATTEASADGTTTADATTAPAGGGGVEDMAARMRRRRQQSLGGS